MTYAPVDGLQLYYQRHGSGRPLVLLHGGLMTIDLNFGPLLEPLAVSRQVIAVELQGHGHTADTDRPMTIEALAGDVVALLDHLEIGEVDLFGFSLGGLVAYAIAPDPTRFDEFAAKTSTMVHEFPGWTDELRSLRVPTMLIFGDRDFSPLTDVVELFELLPDAQLAVLPGTTHMGVPQRPGAVLALITPFLDAS